MKPKGQKDFIMDLLWIVAHLLLETYRLTMSTESFDNDKKFDERTPKSSKANEHPSLSKFLTI